MESNLIKKATNFIGCFFCGLAKNRTWIWSFGNSYTIHCTTRPIGTKLLLSDIGKITAEYFYSNG